VILGGDLNIAHTERDIWAPKRNQETSGFLPHERAWMTGLLDRGWTDTVRRVHGDVAGPYSWWSNFGRARELDRGWRIDYLLATAALAGKVQGAQVHKEGQVASDHAPVSVDLA
jgi:exodeoxyribonuclease-3